MELRNLEKNILYRICESMAEGDPCAPVDSRLIHRAFADLPVERIASGIRALVERGWLRPARDETGLYLTATGRSEIRAFIPPHLLPACDIPEDCA